MKENFVSSTREARYVGILKRNTRMLIVNGVMMRCRKQLKAWLNMVI